jgi:glycine betaine/proline transport system substrate-binding protein
VVREDAHERIFPLLGAGAVDLLAVAWLPGGHASYWRQYGAQAMEVATLYEGARFFWAVPRYVPVSDVASIAELARPQVVDRMTRTIQSIGPGAAITQLSLAAVTEYGLAPSGYVVRSGSAGEWTGAYAAAINGRRWVIFPTWTPQYLNHGGDLRPLADPRGVLGRSNRGVLVAPEERFRALPERTRQVLSRISLGLDGVTEMDRAVNLGGRTIRDAARAWMNTNHDRVRTWFEA